MKLFKQRKSANHAKERLQLVLIHDRTDFNPMELETLKDDLIATISKHVEIEPSGVIINVAQVGRSQRLMADIPLKNIKRRVR